MSKKQRFIFLILFLLFLGAFIFLILNFSPNFKIIIWKFTLPVTILFFILFSLVIFFFFSFLLKNKIQGIIFTIFSLIYLLLRFFGFRHWLFSVLAVLLFIFCEMLILEKD